MVKLPAVLPRCISIPEYAPYAKPLLHILGLYGLVYLLVDGRRWSSAPERLKDG